MATDRHGSKCNECAKVVRRERRRRERALRLKRQLKIAVEPYTLADIADRDQWKCGLCQRKVLADKVVPHPKAPTIDHILPIACGGDDTRANVQLAHFICNARKSDRGTDQLRLTG